MMKEITTQITSLEFFMVINASLLSDKITFIPHIVSSGVANSIRNRQKYLYHKSNPYNKAKITQWSIHEQQRDDAVRSVRNVILIERMDLHFIVDGNVSEKPCSTALFTSGFQATPHDISTRKTTQQNN